jgi:hypothetical protein
MNDYKAQAMYRQRQNQSHGLEVWQGTRLVLGLTIFQLLQSRFDFRDQLPERL